MAKKVLIPQDVSKVGKEFLQGRGYEIKMGKGITVQEMAEDVADCEAILLRTAKCPREVLEAGKKLRIVARHGAGYNNVDVKAAKELGIWVTNTPDVTTKAVAEFTMEAILTMAKQTIACQNAMREGDYFFKNSHKGMSLEGKTLAIIGLGRIGAEVAKKAHDGFGMKIVAYNRNPKTERAAAYVTMVSMEEAFAMGDIVSIHMALCGENVGCIGKELFSKMKESAYFINCARGDLVVESELLDVLREKRIAGAFLDVLKEEPVERENPFWELENVVLTPHMASNTKECMDAMALEAAKQIDLVLSGKAPDYPV